MAFRLYLIGRKAFKLWREIMTTTKLDKYFRLKTALRTEIDKLYKNNEHYNSLPCEKMIYIQNLQKLWVKCVDIWRTKQYMLEAKKRNECIIFLDYSTTRFVYRKIRHNKVLFQGLYLPIPKNNYALICTGEHIRIDRLCTHHNRKVTLDDKKVPLSNRP
jgi:hypothetical protein